MQEEVGDLWEKHAAGEWIARTTNGAVRRDGAAIMGRGIALEAKTKFVGLEYALGERIKLYDNIPQTFTDLRIVTWPTKHHWREASDPLLILRGARMIRSGLLDLGVIPRLYCPRPGCGNGRLVWSEVKRMLTELDDRFIFMSNF